MCLQHSKKHLANISWQYLGLRRSSTVSQNNIPPQMCTVEMFLTLWDVRITSLAAYLQSCVNVLQRVFGSQRGLEGVFDQGDVGVLLWVLNASELLGHREKLSRYLTGIHQQYGSANMQTGTPNVKGLSIGVWDSICAWVWSKKVGYVQMRWADGVR